MGVDRLKAAWPSSSNSGRRHVRPSRCPLPHCRAVEVTIAIVVRVGHEVNPNTTVFWNDEAWTITDDASGLAAKLGTTLFVLLTFVIDGTEVAFSTGIGITRILDH